eukprot:91642_1
MGTYGRPYAYASRHTKRRANSLSQHCITAPVLVHPGKTAKHRQNPSKTGKPPRLKRRQSIVAPRQAWSDPSKYVKSNKIYEDIELNCPNIAGEMRRCNHDQYLYVVSTVIDTMNDAIIESHDDMRLMYNKPLILGYLHDMDCM